MNHEQEEAHAGGVGDSQLTAKLDKQILSNPTTEKQDPQSFPHPPPSKDREIDTNEKLKRDFYVSHLSNEILKETNETPESGLVENPLDRSYPVEAAILSHLGTQCSPPGEPFLLVLPNGESEPAVFVEGKGGLWLKLEKAWLTVPEVFFYWRTGILRRLSKAEKVVWRIRALIEAGLIEPPEVEYLPLPPGASRSIQKVYGGFILRVRIDRTLNPASRGFKWAWSFALPWCDISHFSPLPLPSSFTVDFT